MNASTQNKPIDSKITAPRPPSLKFRIYRQCRIWHGYLSAFAFAALLFFSVTGLMLNHPGWFTSAAPPVQESSMVLTSQQVQDVRSSPSPGEALTQIVADRATLYGEYKDGTVAGDDVFVRLQGARGSSDIRANLVDGSVLVTSEGATGIALLNALHRGETAGMAWRLSIDVMAIVMILVALAGYAIFLSMSGKLRTALLISAASVIAAVLFFLLFVK
jgi:uncharacterized protein